MLIYVARALDRGATGRRAGVRGAGLACELGTRLGAPRLASAFWSMTAPVVLVLDEVLLLHDRECRPALETLG
jgi:hypothetical protein